MKKYLYVLFGAFFSMVMASCGNSSDSNVKKNYDIPSPFLKDSPAPYPVSDDERNKAVDELVELRKKIAVLEGKIIAPAKEDIDKYADFLKDSNTGLARLFPNDSHNEKKPILVNGGGSYYQFKDKTNEYGLGSDVQYSKTNNKPEFSVGFSGLDFGFMAQLGKIDIRDLNEKVTSISYAIEYNSLNNKPDYIWKAERNKWANSGVRNNGILYKERTSVVVGMSYVLRSIAENRYDAVVVFQVVRIDPKDESIVIAWKIINEFEKPIAK